MSTGQAERGSYWKRLAPHRQRWITVAMMLPTVVLAIWFWKTPVEDPLTVSALLLDRVLQFGTAIVLPVALIAILVAPWDIARSAAVATAIVSLGLGGSAIVAALRPPREALPTFVAAASLLFGLAVFLWVMSKVLRSRSWKLSLLAPLALLPAVQFWHQTSFVPARLNTSLVATAGVTVQQADAQASRGIVEIKVQNNSSVGALILASEAIVCFRQTADTTDYDIDRLYGDPECSTEVIVENLSQIDSKSSWTYHKSFRTSNDKPLAQIVAQVWYARNDRLRVDENSKKSLTVQATMGKKRAARDCRGDLTIYRLKEDAKFKGLVQRDKLLVFDDSKTGVGDKYFYLVATGEPLCRDSAYDIGSSLGTGYIRINQEDWLPMPRT